jgi:hypothetical protein
MRDDTFNPCTNCPSKKDTKKNKVVLMDGESDEKHFLLLTPDQVRLLEFLKDNYIDFNDRNTTFDVLDDYEDWEEI